MPLEPQHFELEFNVGLDQSQDEAASDNGLSDLRDFEFHRDRGLTRRPGFQRQDAVGTVPPGTVATIVSSGSTVGAVAGYAAANSFSDQGVPKFPQQFSHHHVFRQSYGSDGESAIFVDGASVGGTTCLVEQFADGAISIKVTDEFGAVLYYSRLPASFFDTAVFRVVAANGRYIILARDQATLKLSAISINIATSVATLTPDILGAIDAGTIYGVDAVADPSKSYVYISWADNTNHYGIAIWDGATAITTSVLRAVAANVVRTAVVRDIDPLYGRVHLAYTFDGTGNWRTDIAHHHGTTLVNLGGGGSLDFGFGAAAPTDHFIAIHGIVHAYDPVTAFSALQLVAVDTNPLFTNPATMRFLVWGSLGVTAAPGAFVLANTVYGTTALSKPFIQTTLDEDHPSPQLMMAVARTVDWVDTTGSLVGPVETNFRHAWLARLNMPQGPSNETLQPVAMLISDAGPSVEGFASVTSIDGGVWDVPLRILTFRTVSVDPFIEDRRWHADAIMFRVSTGQSKKLYGTPARYGALPTAAGGGAHVGGGLLRFFDGINLGETVPLYPPLLKAEVAVGVVPTPAGRYAYTVTAEWVDADGRTHRTAPAPPQFLQMDGLGTNVAKLTVVGADHAWCSILSLYTGRRWHVKIWRTQDNLATLYQRFDAEFTGTDVVMTEEGSGTTGGPTVFLSDALLSANDAIYTTGGILDNIAPPAPVALMSHANRVWGVAAQDPRRVFFSKELEDGIAFEFNTALAIRVDDAVGDVRALASMDDKAILFTDDAVYAVATGGGGPNALGQGVYPPPELVARGVGCQSATGVVSTPLGVLFLSRSGFKLLGRDLNVSDLGKDLLDLADGSIPVGASLDVPERQQVWYALNLTATSTLASTDNPLRFGGLLVFDYARGKMRWGYWLPYRALTNTCAVLSLGRILGRPSLVFNTDTSAFDGTIVAALAVPAASGTSVHADNAVWPYDVGNNLVVSASVTSAWFRPDGPLGDVRFRVAHWSADVDAAESVGTVTLDTFLQAPGTDDMESVSETHDWVLTAVPVGTPAHRRVRLGKQRGTAIKLRLTVVPESAAASALTGGVFNSVGLEFGVRGRAAKPGGSLAPG